MAKLVLPICGDLIDTDVIVGATYLPPYRSAITKSDGLPRVRVDTHQMLGAHLIDCDSVETALKVRDAIIAACMPLPPAPVAEPATAT
jgi:hypothetical protein